MQHRSAALDISTLDDALLSLLLSPERLKSLFKYTKFSPLAHTYSSTVTNTGQGNATATYLDLRGDENEDQNEGYHAHRLLLCLLRGLIIFFTSASDAGSTPAITTLQSKVVSSLSPGRAPKRRDIYKWIILSSGIPAAYHAIKLLSLSYSHHLHHSSTLNETGETLQSVAHQRQLKIISYVLGIVDRIVPPLVLFQHIRCIFQQSHSKADGTFIPPSLGMYLAGLTIAPVVTSSFSEGGSDMTRPVLSVIQRNVHFLYAYRRFLFQELMSLFEVFFPRDGFKYIMEGLQKRRRMRAIRKSKKGDLVCPICNTSPILIPYKVDPCGHVYCYTCLRRAALTSEHFNCNLCHQRVHSSRPHDFREEAAENT